jgi:transcriptional regulator with XRE-family HTH domain
MSMNRTLGLYIRQRRTLLGLSLSEFSRQSGVNKSVLSNIENGGDFKVSTLGLIAAGFGMGAGDLLVEAGYTNGKAHVNSTASARDYVLRVTTIGGVPVAEIVRDAR